MRVLLASLAALSLASCSLPPVPAPATNNTPDSQGPALTVKQVAASGALGAARAESEDKTWRRATDYEKMLETDVYWLLEVNGPYTHYVDQYDEEENYSRALTIVSPPATAVGGGILFYVRDVETQQNIPVTYVDGNARFELNEGTSYYVYAELFLDGASTMEIDGAALMQEFVSQGNDTLSFSMDDNAAYLYINGEAFGGTLAWLPENPDLPYTSSYNTVGLNPEGRSAWRKRNFELYGGYGYVAEFLLP